MDPMIEQIEKAVRAALPEGSMVTVGANGRGHFTIEAISPAFAGLSRLEQQRLVYAAIAPLMAGNEAPVHAIDKLVTKTTP